MKKRKSGGSPGVGQGGSERRIEVIVKMRKKVEGSGRGVRSGIRVDVYVELKLLGWSGGRGLVGSKVGVVGDVGYGGCKLRIEGIVKFT